MQRPIWKGHISFGLVNIPVTLYSAEKRTELHFHLLDSRNKARVRYERINDETGKEVPWNEIVKAFEVDQDNYVILKDEDFKRAAPKAVKTIEIEDFVNLSEIDYMYFEKPYILVPDKFGEKGYVLLRESLKKEKKVGIAKIVIRSKQYLAAVLACKNMLMIILLRFAQELRKADEFTLPEEDLKKYRITERELKMAAQLIEGMTNKWKPENYHDEYREALMQWIEEKAIQGKPKRTRKTKEKEEPGKVIDFMQLLKDSLKQTKHESKSHRKKG